MRLRIVSHGLNAVALCALLSAADTNQATSSGLTARQLFYKQPVPSVKPEATQKDPPSAPAVKGQAPSVKRSKRAPAATAPTTSEAPTANPVATAPPVSHETEMARLGLRYSVLKGSSLDEVDSQQVFRSGDHFRLKLKTNEQAYLYVIMKQSQGDWKPLFPSPEIENNNNYVAAGQELTIPAGKQDFFFDNHPGEERLVVVVSRQQERDLDRLVESVRHQAEEPTPTLANKSDTVLSQNVGTKGIANDEMQRVRTQMKSRGIGITDTNPKKAAGYEAEKAVYVVTAASPEPHLVADIVLKHK